MRTERSHEHGGIRYRELWQERSRYPAKPLSRRRAPVAAPDPDLALARLDDERAAMAERVLREGIRGRRRWSTLRARSGPDFSPILVETELLDDLCRHAGLIIEDRFKHERWVVDAFEVDDSMRSWLGLIDPATIHAELEAELRNPQLIAALAAGPPPGVDWRSFTFVLRAGQRALDLREYGLMPSQRELAGLVDHTKAWTPRRKRLLSEILCEPFEALVAVQDRQLGIRGPVTHPEGGLWASAVGQIVRTVAEVARGVILVENVETFRVLSALAEERWIVVNVPGGPPPAECELVARIGALAPTIVFHAAFDLDPAGIRIARILQDRAGISLDPRAMAPELLKAAPRRLDLNEWDHDQLVRLDGHAGVLEGLRQAICKIGAKVEQETLHHQLLSIFAGYQQREP